MKKYIIITATLFIIFIGVLIHTLFPTPKRYAIFAGYNADKTIHPYVITYLKGLKEVTDGIVYIADSELNAEEYKKLDGLVLYTEHKRHLEYDWGSYKRGYNWLRANGYLKDADELILANDSCYAPLTSFKPMFKEMAKRKDLDFWGDLMNTRYTPHLQSYFLVFRKKVLNSRKIAEFLNNVAHQQDNSQYILNYEVKFTKFLADAGYKWSTYMPYDKLDFLRDTDKNTYPYTLITLYKHQFLKRRTFTDSLIIYENRQELVKYIYKHFPKTYLDLAPEIPSFYLPQTTTGQN